MENFIAEIEFYILTAKQWPIIQATLEIVEMMVDWFSNPITGIASAFFLAAKVYKFLERHRR